MSGDAQTIRDKIHRKLVKEFGSNFKKVTPKMLKRVFHLIDKHFYGLYINNTLQEKGEILKLNVYYDEDEYDDGKVYIKNVDNKIQHHVEVNGERFVNIDDFELPPMLAKAGIKNKIDRMMALQYIVENETIPVVMDLYLDVKKEKDRPYDMYGEKRKIVCETIFGNCYFYGMHRKVKTRRENLWFEYKNKIMEGKLKEYVKDEPFTIVVTKDDKEYKVPNENIVPKEPDEHYVEK